MKQNRRKKSASPADDAETQLTGTLPGLVTEQLGDDVELNLRIVSLLQEDGRMPFSTIAERTGVSEGTVRNRVNQLRAANVMAVTASVSPEAFGYRWNSTTLMKVNPAASIDKLAMRLARSTVSGAGERARLSPEPASRLREDVTSPKGTTLEALKILMGARGIEPIFIEAIAAATRRSRELAE